jgi:hypothetical protein
MSRIPDHERSIGSPASVSRFAGERAPGDARRERQPAGSVDSPHPAQTGRHGIKAEAGSRRDPRLVLVNVLIAILTLIVGFLFYSLLARTFFSPPVDTERSGIAAGSTIQLDVLNGCGASNAGAQFTSYLRARGFDVVEIRNYKTFDVEKSLVIDRAGNMENARKVAYALGVGKGQTIQQMNQDYYVDVSVVIGKDYKSLKPSM